MSLPDASAALAGRFTSRSTWPLIAALIALVGALALCLDHVRNGDFYLSLVSGRFIAHIWSGSRSAVTRALQANPSLGISPTIPAGDGVHSRIR